VTDVPKGPAKDAGLKSGDIIREFDGNVIDSTRTLVRVVADIDIQQISLIYQ
jgi:serine protease Do